jgi:glyoxylase I family protein
MHGLPNHLDLTVTDLARSTAFYDLVLTTLGYARSKEYAGEVPCWVIHMDVQVQKPTLFTISPQDPQELRSTPKRVAFSIGLHQARSDRAHDRYSTGLHHLALHADSRADVDAFHALLLGAGITVLDPPAEYDYTPGYYAVFFADPDGMKLELVHEPRFDTM